MRLVNAMKTSIAVRTDLSERGSDANSNGKTTTISNTWIVNLMVELGSTDHAMDSKLTATKMASGTIKGSRAIHGPGTALPAPPMSHAASATRRRRSDNAI